ncbi:hypothetical protein [Rhodococcus maanshanensis]|uniref:DUF4760 domain-containing protein n=1 Tax=Rhodococcus maanshanensis TaxID=183556 RepID=A0A1H7YMX7_9NOCA|nr:hypothetical protein [Rhodococcus maanshanensis]SEM47194.1 hypothetical protein SAMN05444583_14210 [Rhodococcus maanshanensis]
MWTTLEIAKLAVAALIPLSVAGLGWWVTRLTKRIEAAQWRNQKLVEKRISLVDTIAPDLNDLYCYFLCIGRWKELSPVDVIALKRKLDHSIHVNRPYLSPSCVNAYSDFISQLFKTFTGPGNDAQLRTSLESSDGSRPDAYRGTSAWNPSWNTMFREEETDRATVKRLYDELIAQITEQVGISPRAS